MEGKTDAGREGDTQGGGERREEARRGGKEGKWEAWEGRGYRHALVPLN